MRAYYNDHDPWCCEWIRNLIAEGLVTPGDVDDRPIQEVRPDDVMGYDRVHFFAGVAGWEHALNLADWGERRVWTGSCPCQPYSSAGKGKGDKDERNLWPDFFRLIRESRPDAVFGEQVEGAIRHGWLDGVQADLEGEGYAVGHCVLGAHSVNAPHIRQRLFWVGVAQPGRLGNTGCESGITREGVEQQERHPGTRQSGAVDCGVADAHGRGRGGLADAGREQRQRRAGEQRPGEEGAAERGEGVVHNQRCGAARGVFHPASDGRGQGRAEPDGRSVAGGRGVDLPGDALGVTGGDGLQGILAAGAAAGVTGFLDF